jgi:hypothetical protein
VKADIYYTLDGTVPTKNSTRYAGPIRIERPTTLSAVALGPGKNLSIVATSTYHRSFNVVSASYLSHYSSKYRGSGDSTLIDGKRGTSSYANPAWQAFEGEDCSVILDLGQVRTVHSVALGCLSEMGSWIFYPASISIAVSQDGKTFGKEVTRDLGVPTSMEDSGAQDLAVEVGGVVGRYVRVTAKNIGTCPPWHPGKGGKAWIFMDEIFVE